MEKFMQGLYDICISYQPFVWILAGVSVGICGIMMAIPSQKTKEAAKSALPWVIVGVGLVLGAFIFGKEISSKFVF